MPIVAVQADLFRTPLPTPVSDSTHGVMREFNFIVVRVRDHDGVEGLGYTTASGATGATMRGLIAGPIKDRLIGRDADRIEPIWRELFWSFNYSGRGGPGSNAVSAVDIALWDLQARRAGLPLWRYLGGFDPRVPCYAGGIDLNYTLDELLRQTDDNLAKGFRAIKMKVGRANLKEDIDRVRAMRRHLGDNFPLMVDANIGWNVEQSIRAARALAEFDLVWLEEPTHPDDHSGNARIAREGGLPIASGETLRTLQQFQQIITLGGVTFPEPDAGNCGGVTTFMKVCALAEAHNLPVTSHGVHDVTVHLLAAVPNRSYLEVHGFGLDRFIKEPLRIEAGFAIAPERPGHGIEFDWAALEPLRVG